MYVNRADRMQYVSVIVAWTWRQSNCQQADYSSDCAIKGTLRLDYEHEFLSKKNPALQMISCSTYLNPTALLRASRQERIIVQFPKLYS